jgi:hypothetical protein
MVLPLPAVACPERAHCVTRLDVPVVEAPAAKPTPEKLDLRLSPRMHSALDHELAIHRAPRTAALDMPWIWQVLRRAVYDRLPTYRERAFTMTVSPVVVEGSFDTVPGVGLAGDF